MSALISLLLPSSACSVASVVSNSLWPHGLYLARLLCPWGSQGKDTGAGCCFLFQGLFPTQGSNRSLLHLLHWQAGFLPLAPPGKPCHLGSRATWEAVPPAPFKCPQLQPSWSTSQCPSSCHPLSSMLFYQWSTLIFAHSAMLSFKSTSLSFIHLVIYWIMFLQQIFPNCWVQLLRSTLWFL